MGKKFNPVDLKAKRQSHGICEICNRNEAFIVGQIGGKFTAICDPCEAELKAAEKRRMPEMHEVGRSATLAEIEAEAHAMFPAAPRADWAPMAYSVAMELNGIVRFVQVPDREFARIVALGWVAETHIKYGAKAKIRIALEDRNGRMFALKHIEDGDRWQWVDIGGGK